MAERYPGARIVAVSNSRTQRAHILARATERGLDNLTVLTADDERPHPADEGHRCASWSCHNEGSKTAVAHDNLVAQSTRLMFVRPV